MEKKCKAVELVGEVPTDKLMENMMKAAQAGSQFAYLQVGPSPRGETIIREAVAEASSNEVAEKLVELGKLDEGWVMKDGVPVPKKYMKG